MKTRRSGFEDRMGAVLEPQGFKYEPYQTGYTVHKKYTPDWVAYPRGDLRVLVEAKGWFRPGDTQKYSALHGSLLAETGRDWPREELVFLLQYPDKKVRKGAVLTMSGWCDKHGIRWFDDPEDLSEYVWELAR